MAERQKIDLTDYNDEINAVNKHFSGSNDGIIFYQHNDNERLAAAFIIIDGNLVRAKGVYNWAKTQDRMYPDSVTKYLEKYKPELSKILEPILLPSQTDEELVQTTLTALEKFSKSDKGGLRNDKDEVDAIIELQKFLVSLGLDTGGIDGKYGKKTNSAVLEFQKQQGISTDGDAGPITIRRIKEVVEDLNKIKELIAKLKSKTLENRVSFISDITKKLFEANLTEDELQQLKELQAKYKDFRTTFNKSEFETDLFVIMDQAIETDGKSLVPMDTTTPTTTDGPKVGDLATKEQSDYLKSKFPDSYPMEGERLSRDDVEELLKRQTPGPEVKPEPEVTEPEVTEPEVTEPEVTELIDINELMKPDAVITPEILEKLEGGDAFEVLSYHVVQGERLLKKYLITETRMIAEGKLSGQEAAALQRHYRNVKLLLDHPSVDSTPNDGRIGEVKEFLEKVPAELKGNDDWDVTKELSLQPAKPPVNDPLEGFVVFDGGLPPAGFVLYIKHGTPAVYRWGKEGQPPNPQDFTTYMAAQRAAQAVADRDKKQSQQNAEFKFAFGNPANPNSDQIYSQVTAYPFDIPDNYKNKAGPYRFNIKKGGRGIWIARVFNKANNRYDVVVPANKWTNKYRSAFRQWCRQNGVDYPTGNIIK